MGMILTSSVLAPTRHADHAARAAGTIIDDVAASPNDQLLASGRQVRSGSRPAGLGPWSLHRAAGLGAGKSADRRRDGPGCRAGDVVRGRLDRGQGVLVGGRRPAGVLLEDGQAVARLEERGSALRACS